VVLDFDTVLLVASLSYPLEMIKSCLIQSLL